ncbi:hypothetical protein GCM10011511_16030 [Puia dinghuensis]|uniref:Diiron non-heme beta-hydroxylase N-terminal domain-containing protein n=2 Tax=Puia dinghuensis TaxID=1792502 RepID=A0A8J2UBB2_9BACT|nr:hypothetical protein GCM10011511_16030 [Puia dinghuensis]
MNLVNRHLKIMESYVNAPSIHAASVKNANMKGGPFIDLDGQKVDEIKQLIAYTRKQQSHMIDLTKSIYQLEKLLKEKATGYSLEGLYAEIPENLRGFVELVYDLNNNPSYRLFEALFYRSIYYNKNRQSIAFWITSNNERPFVLSTPRLDKDDVCHLPLPFDSPVIDELAKMKRKSNGYEDIKNKLSLSGPQETLFSTFFTEEEPAKYQNYSGDKVRLRYFGHACILIETANVSLLIDPLISYYGYMSEIDKFSDVDLPDTIDYVLITHNHQDHILLETLLPLRHKIKNIIVPDGGNRSIQDPRLKLVFGAIGFDNVMELAEFEKIQGKECTIMGIPFLGEHCDLDIMSKICYHVKFGKFSVLLVADSRISEPMFYERIYELTGDIDVICFGMECDGAPLSWLYGPLLTSPLQRDKDNSRRLAGSNFAKGKGFIDTFHPKEVYVYAMGMEPWVEFISSIKYTPESSPIVESDKILAYCKEKGIIAERLFGEKELLYQK